MQEFKIEEELGRIDSALADMLDYSRSKVVKMIKEGLILVNGETTKSSYQLRIGDKVSVGEYIEEEMSAEPEEMDLDIVYEDDDFIFCNKPVDTILAIFKLCN